ncbi:MAG: glycosyltransferase family 4 protein [Acidimicrobiales bacterium]
MSPLSVAYDVTPVLSGRTGIARYVTELSRGLESNGVDVRRYGVGRAQFPAPARTKHLRVPLRAVQRSWSAGGPPLIERLSGAVDIVHSTSLVVPRSRRPIVVTIYDTAPLDHPDLHSARTVRGFETLMHDLPRAAAVLTVSKSVAADLARHGVDPDRVTTVYLGRTAFPVPEPVDMPRPFLLTVGEQVPRKDQTTLVRAFARADLGDVHLALVGPPGEATPGLRALVAELRIEGRVHFLDAVDDAGLAWLYASALAYCFPSVGEGFVTPVVEAMAAGLPVVASEIAPTIEIAGGVALLHPVGDVALCCAALERVVHEPGLAAHLGDLGRDRAASFTWERTAAQTVAVYEQTLTARS